MVLGRGVGQGAGEGGARGRGRADAWVVMARVVQASVRWAGRQGPGRHGADDDGLTERLDHAGRLDLVARGQHGGDRRGLTGEGAVGGQQSAGPDGQAAELGPVLRRPAPVAVGGAGADDAAVLRGLEIGDEVTPGPETDERRNDAGGQARGGSAGGSGELGEGSERGADERHTGLPRVRSGERGARESDAFLGRARVLHTPAAHDGEGLGRATKSGVLNAAGQGASGFHPLGFGPVDPRQVGPTVARGVDRREDHGVHTINHPFRSGKDSRSSAKRPPFQPQFCL